MRLLAISLLGLLAACQSETDSPQPIIDMHRHAPLADAEDPTAAMVETLEEMDQYNVVLAALSITSVDPAWNWAIAEPDRFLAGPMLPCPRNLGEPWYICFPVTDGVPDIDWLRIQIEIGHIGMLHEMMFNYDGSFPDDPKMTPYWALAHEFDLPVGVHTWSGPPPGASIRKNPNCCPDYNGDIGYPRHLRPILEKYPGLRIWIQHVGSDGEQLPQMWEETLALLADYPNVYVDLSITNSLLPIESYEAALTRLFDAGFGDRIMFGSDNLPIEMVLDRLNSLENISEAQKRAILHDNAARFLRLNR